MHVRGTYGAIQRYPQVAFPAGAHGMLDEVGVIRGRFLQRFGIVLSRAQEQSNDSRQVVEALVLIVAAFRLPVGLFSGDVRHEALPIVVVRNSTQGTFTVDANRRPVIRME